MFALPLALLFAGPVEAAKRHHGGGGGGGSWDGRWAGAWGGNDPTAVIVKGGKVVAYEYGGSTTPVSSSRVTPKRITYGENNIVRDDDPHRAEYGARDDQDGTGEWDGGVDEVIVQLTPKTRSRALAWRSRFPAPRFQCIRSFYLQSVERVCLHTTR